MKKSKYTNKEIKEFLRESNHIESEYSDGAFNDALKAWKYLKKQPLLTVENILETHKLLMTNLRPDIAGFWRNCDVYIGGQKKHFISVQLIQSDISEVLNEMIFATSDEDTKKCHILFESVHPFEDGNGRTGRLLYLWHRTQLGLPIHIIHADWPKEDGEQRNYYKWFRVDK